MGENTSPIATLDLLASLVESSLVHFERGTGDESRYTMLAVIREFGLEQLTAHGEADRARQRHARWCLDIADAGELESGRPTGEARLAMLKREHANLRAALRWFAEQEEGRSLLQMTGALWQFWRDHAHYQEGRRWLELALDLGPADLPEYQLRALTGAGALAWYGTDVAQAYAWMEQTLPLARLAGNREDEAFAQINLGSLAFEMGYHEQATSHQEAGLALARGAGLPEPTVVVLHNLGFQAWLRGEAAAATRRYEEALELARRHDISWIVPNILIGLRFAITDLGGYGRAAAYLHEGLELGITQVPLGDVIEGMEGLARLSAAIGQPAQATRLFGAAAAMRVEIATPYIPTERNWIEPLQAALRAKLGAECFHAEWAAGATLPLEQAITVALAVNAESATPDVPAVRPAATHGLTARELEILRLIAAGRINREVADDLFISPATVARHIANIYRKLDVDSRAKLTAFALQQGLL